MECKSSLKVVLHVFLGLPFFLFPRFGAHSIAVLGCRWVGILRMWPAKRNLCKVIVSWRLLELLLVRTSSFVVRLW